MARLALSAQRTLGSYPDRPITPGDADLTWTLAGVDFADGFSFPWTARTVLLVRNDSGAAARTVSVDSVPSTRTRREGDIEDYSVANTEYAMFGPFRADGWLQANGLIYGAASAADVALAVIELGR